MSKTREVSLRAKSRAEMLEAFYVSVDERYGSMDAFLTELGVDQEARLALAAALTP